MSLSRFLAPGLLVLLFGQAHAQPPEYWYVSTRACPQVLGTEPGPSLQVSRFDSQGCISRCDPGELQAAANRRPVIFLIHGSYYTAPMAVTEGPRIRNNLAAHGALTPDAIVVTFDWPSEFAHPNVIRDTNDKARLAFVAGFHLARFLQGFPAGTRISLVWPQPWWTCRVICPSTPRGRDARHGGGGNRSEGGQPIPSPAGRCHLRG